MSYGLDLDQFRLRVVRPTLHYMQLHSQAAENLLVGTALTESRLKFIQQLGGPALGLYQMEPATFRDVYDNYLSYRPDLVWTVNQLRDRRPTTMEEELVYNMAFATAMARVHYRRVPAPLPDAADAMGLAKYWKIHYNTSLGKGSVLHAFEHFKVAVDT